jgi:hypothetical protein
MLIIISKGSPNSECDEFGNFTTDYDFNCNGSGFEDGSGRSYGNGSGTGDNYGNSRSFGKGDGNGDRYGSGNGGYNKQIEQLTLLNIRL